MSPAAFPSNTGSPPLPAAIVGGQTAVLDLPIDPATAAPAVAEALRSANLSVTGWAQDRIAFDRRYRGAFTLGTRVRYRGQVLLAPVPGGARATVTLKFAPVSYVLAAILIALLLTVLSLIGNADSPKATVDAAAAADPSYRAGRALGYVMLPLIVAGIGYIVLLRGTTKRLAESVGALGTVAARAPAHGAPTATAPEGMVEQLRKLAELRDQGVLAAGEFDQAKAALLARLA